MKNPVACLIDRSCSFLTTSKISRLNYKQTVSTRNMSVHQQEPTAWRKRWTTRSSSREWQQSYTSLMAPNTGSYKGGKTQFLVDRLGQSSSHPRVRGYL